MARLLMTLRYDGTAYHGWQVQANAVTVQQVLQDAIERITGVRSGVTGCSRTDAGVHARMFCCTTDTASSLRGEKLCAALNAVLPADVAVYDVREVPDVFHPRYDALGKCYEYVIYNGRHRDPLYEGRAWHINRRLDEEQLDAAAKRYLGTRNFAAFQASGSSVEDTVRTVTHASVRREGDLVIFSVCADGFLYNMVRIMVGTLTDIAFGKIAPEAIETILQEGKRELAGVTAPAQGLYLHTVFYPPMPSGEEGGGI